VVSFFNELEIKKPCSKTSVSFFNEVAAETQKLSSVVSFFNELEIKKPCSKTSVSFFNEVASEMQKLSSVVSFLTSLKSKNHAQRPLFHFLMRLPQRHKNYPRNLCFIF
jgi:hypothetical protein